MLLVIGAIIALILILITFVVNLASAQNVTTPSWIGQVGNMTDVQNGTNKTKPSESLTIGGLSPQGENNLAIACSVVREC